MKKVYDIGTYIYNLYITNVTHTHQTNLSQIDYSTCKNAKSAVFTLKKINDI